MGIGQLFKKELNSFFSSPLGYIFTTAFVFICFFIFYYIEKFFQRNIADIRLLFQWMPILLIFICSALTMRSWSEEKKQGTLEYLFSNPIKISSLVFSKFLANLVIILIVLLITLILPITVSILGDIDLGPVIGGYVATVFLASAYLSIGLFISSKTDNQIVSLITSVLVCYVFYFIGSDLVSSIFGPTVSNFLARLGTGSRFLSIERGIIDFRDLYYYLTIFGIFITLNILSLKKLFFSTSNQTKNKNRTWIFYLIIFNLLISNLWISKVNFLRMDLTEGNIYSPSSVSKKIISNLEEPLKIRAFFSKETHPLLAPLVPQVIDFINEYKYFSKNKVQIDIVDPISNSIVEREINEKHGIAPTPFQVDDHYSYKVINSYFAILLQYGNESEVLNFQDLIEVRPSPEGKLEIKLRNIEYDLTSKIKKIINSFNNSGDIIDNIENKVNFISYISENNLPENLEKYKDDQITVLSKFKENYKDKFDFQIINPDEKIAQEILGKFGFSAMSSSFFSDEKFYFYNLIENNGKYIQLGLDEKLSKDTFESNLNSAIKRFSKGFVKKIGIDTPKPSNSQNPFMPTPPSISFSYLKQRLTDNYNIESLNLESGFIKNDIDLLLLMSPENYSPKALFAIDQFLMKGGTVIINGNNFKINRAAEGISSIRVNTGLNNWLKAIGLELQDNFVYDLKNEPYPVPVVRDISGFKVEEIKAINYPLFPDIRRANFLDDSLIFSNLNQITLNWASPIKLNKIENLSYEVLFKSSNDSWFGSALNLIPDFETYPENGFKEDTNQANLNLGVVVKGTFESFFKDNDSPLLGDSKSEVPTEKSEQEDLNKYTSKIVSSSSSAKVVLIPSSNYLSDQVFQLSAALGSNRYINSLQFIENLVDISVNDPELLKIRNIGSFSRTLVPLSDNTKKVYEMLNYILALVLIFSIYLIYRFKNNKFKKSFQFIMEKNV